MIQLNGSLTIARPPEEVYAFLADLNNIPKWETGVLHSEVTTPGPTRVGTQFTETVKMSFGTFEAKCEVTNLQPNRSITFRATSKMLSYEGTWRCDPADGGTQVTVSGSANLSGFKKFFEWMMKREVTKEIDEKLHTIKRLLESTSA